MKPKETNLYDLKDGDVIYLLKPNNLDNKVRLVDITISEKHIGYFQNAVTNGCWFVTPQQAKIELQKRQVEFELKRYAFTPNRKSDNKQKWWFEYDFDEKDIAYRFNFDRQCPLIYFKNQKNMEKAIQAVGKERLIAYLTGELYKGEENNVE